MTDQSNLFESQQQEQSKAVDQQQQQAPNTDPLQDLLGSIRNEQGAPKYRDIPSALDGLKHSQDFIQTLKREKQELEDQFNRMKVELEKRSSVEDIVQRLASQNSDAGKTNTSGLSEQQIAEMVNNQLSKHQRVSVETQNLEAVNRTLIERFGERAGETLKAKADELGLTIQELGDLAKKTPKAVLAFFPQGSIQPQQQSKDQGLNTSGFQGAPATPDVPRPSKSLLAGASSREQAEYMKAIKKHIYEKYGVTE